MAQAGIPAIIGAVAAVGGTAASIHQSKKAQAANEKADKASRAASEIANQRNIKKNTVKARVLQAQLIASGGASTGSFSGSSATTGAVGSVGSTAAGQQGFARTQQAGFNAVQRQQAKARGFASNAATFGQVAALPGAFGFDIGSVFKEGTVNPNLKNK